VSHIKKQRADLIAALDRHAELAIAVSGGVDSMVLAYVAHRFSRTKATVVHAVSPAVPELATQRVRAHACTHGWTLRLIDAGEMADPAYISNPVDRCFYCKSNLYGRIARMTGSMIASGTNVDDLSDYRPGLKAAQEHQVCHPYVEAGLHKSDIYALAAAHGLTDLAALPAQPCLSSRIETGIAVDAATLKFIERAEQGLAQRMPASDAIRCRITSVGVVIECAHLPEGEQREQVERWVADLCSESGRSFAGLRPYRRGAAFLRQVTA